MLARLAACSLLAVACAAQASPSFADAMGYDDARHLLLRTGFAPTDAQVREYAPLTRSQGVDRILRGTRTTAITPPPAFTGETESLRYPDAGSASPEARRVFRQKQIRQGLELRAWWVQEMLVTPSPLTERMTLFWHDHFVSSQQKVRFARLMYAQNVTFRAHALGNFATLLHAASKEPAMLIYLDGAQSRKQQPNENFAREVMELFTLGEGHYSEQDIKEAARAFTGWSIDRDAGTYRYRPALHDTGVKTVLGKSGRFDGDAVLDIILARPETARFVAAKLWREFVSPKPDPREVERIAQVFRDSGYDIEATLRALFLSAAFWSPDHRGTLVKSPIEIVVGALRQLDVDPVAALPFAVAAAGMGQNLFSPPNVKGWPGGEAWIDSNTLLARKQFLDRLARGDDTRPAMAMATVAGPDGTAAGTTNDASGPATPMALPTAQDPQEPRATPRPGASVPATKPAAATDAVLAGLRPPRAAIADAVGVAADDERRSAQRFNLAMSRALRSVDFNAARWISKQPGATPLEKMRSARALLLPVDAVLADPPTVDSAPQAFVRATLLDPAYQLK